MKKYKRLFLKAELEVMDRFDLINEDDLIKILITNIEKLGVRVVTINLKEEK